MENNKKFLKFLIALLTFCIMFDQMTKTTAESHLMTYSDTADLTLYKGKKISLYEIENTDFEVSFGLNYVRNLGAAWGTLAKLSDGIRIPFFYAFTAIALIVLGIFFYKTPPHNRFARTALVLIFSGAVGNAIDRLRLGYVIDWIDVRWIIYGWKYNFPNFNGADIFITIGFIMMLIDGLIFDLRKKK